MRGMDVAAFLICISFAFAALAGMGWYAWAGVQPESGGFETEGEEASEAVLGLEEEDDETVFGIDIPTAQDIPGASLVVSGMEYVKIFWGVVVNVRGLVEIYLGRDLALAIGGMIALTFGFAIAQYVRGVISR